MKNLLRYLMTIGLLLMALSVHAQANGELLSRIAARLARHEVVRADFVQTKHVAAMKRPLVTSGKLAYAKMRGALWQIERPYRIAYALGEDRIVEVAADGSRRQRNAADLPGFVQVSRVFRAMFSADVAQLRDYFDIQAHGNDNRWDILLKPRQAHIAQFIGGIQISGGQYVEAIRIDEASGDTTRIQFRNSASDTALTVGESQAFVSEQ